MESARSSKSTPCPVCGRTKDSDCAFDEADQGLKVRCHTYINQDPQISGWVYRGSTGDGMWGLFFEKNEKDDRVSQTKEFIYRDENDQPVVKVVRVDKAGGSKSCYQYRYEDGKWELTLGKGAKAVEVKKRIHLYRIFEEVNQKAKTEGQPLFLVEGEGKVDLLISMGVAATTAIGGAKKFVMYGHQNYLHDLEGFQIVLCPDRDIPGVEHCETINQYFPSAKWFYAYPDSSVWQSLPDKNGLDIADWIAEFKPSVEWIYELIEDKARKVKIAAGNGESQESNRKTRPDSDYPDISHLDPADEVDINTIDDQVFKRIFDGGKGRYIVINSAFYKYTDQGYWAHLDDEVVENTIADYTRRAYKLRRNERGDLMGVKFPFAKTGNVSSSFTFARTLLSSKSAQLYNRHLLCFKNCTVDLRTGEIMEHSPSHYITTKIDADYEPGLPCPDAFGEFLYSAFGEDIFEVIQAVTSMLIDPTAPYGQAPHCIGPSGSGKGTLIETWEGMFGPDNVRSGSSFSELATPEGRYQNLTGVKLFTCPDLGGRQEQLRAYYNLVDNVPMSARPLFAKRNIQVRFDARFASASVDHLQIENSGDGWDRRCIPLPTKQRRGPMDRNLKSKLSEVKAQIISWALSMPRAKRDYILNNLSSYERIEEAKGNASVAGDPVRSFVDMCLRPAPDTSQKIDPYKLHTWYTAYCHTFGYQRMAMTRFVNHLRGVIPHHYNPRRRASKEEDLNCARIPAHWAELEPLEDVFQEFTAEGDFCKCIKKQCQEGGLWQFADYANEVLNKLNPAANHVPQRPSTFTKENNTLDTIDAIPGNGLNGFVQQCPAVPIQNEQIKNGGSFDSGNGQKSDKTANYFRGAQRYRDTLDTLDKPYVSGVSENGKVAGHSGTSGTNLGHEINSAYIHHEDEEEEWRIQGFDSKEEYERIMAMPDGYEEIDGGSGERKVS